MRLLPLLVVLVPAAALAQPGYYGTQPSSAALRNGLTFEANLGLGVIWASAEGESSDSELALGGLSLGLGGWVSPQLAITARIAGVTYSEDCGDETCMLTSAFFGPVAQYWLNEQAWIGGGAGLAVLRGSTTGSGDSETENGFGLNLRAGYTFSRGTESTWNVSVEYTPGFYTLDYVFGEYDLTVHGFGILFGYQHL